MRLREYEDRVSWLGRLSLRPSSFCLSIMRIVFLGSGEFAVPTLRWLTQSEHEVSLVVTQPARPSGRGRIPTPTPVANFAQAAGWQVLEVENVNEPAVVSRLRSMEARLGLVIAFGQKLGSDVLAVTPTGFINLHASLLPQYRGAAPINWAMMRGEEKTGCTMFRIVGRMDAGPILTQRWTFVKAEETAGELHDRLAGIGVDAVRAALELFQDGAIPAGEPQDDTLATLAPKLKKSDGFLWFDGPVRDVVNHIRGVTPWPGASAVYRNQAGKEEGVLLTRVRPIPVVDSEREPSAVGESITRVRRSPIPESSGVGPGEIDERLFVASRDGFLEILEIKPSSGRVMSWPDFVNGRHVTPGDRFLSPPR